MFRKFKSSVFVFLAGVGFSCTHLHHVQVSEMDLSRGGVKAFNVKTSHTGVNLRDAAEITKAIAGNQSKVGKASDTAGDFWEAITYGPRTGEVTFSDDYADSILVQITAACPLDRIAGLATMRETNRYPIISGEIVNVTGYCRN